MASISLVQLLGDEKRMARVRSAFLKHPHGMNYNAFRACMLAFPQMADANASLTSPGARDGRGAGSGAAGTVSGAAATSSFAFSEMLLHTSVGGGGGRTPAGFSRNAAEKLNAIIRARKSIIQRSESSESSETAAETIAAVEEERKSSITQAPTDTISVLCEFPIAPLSSEENNQVAKPTFDTSKGESADMGSSMNVVSISPLLELSVTSEVASSVKNTAADDEGHESKRAAGILTTSSQSGLMGPEKPQHHHRTRGAPVVPVVSPSTTTIVSEEPAASSMESAANSAVEMMHGKVHMNSSDAACSCGTVGPHSDYKENLRCNEKHSLGQLSIDHHTLVSTRTIDKSGGGASLCRLPSPLGVSGTSGVLFEASFYNEDNRDHSRLHARKSRLRSRQELAGTVTVEPLKQLFNFIDHHNHGVITWSELFNYVVSEARLNTTALKEDVRPYTFSRQRQGQITQATKGSNQRTIEEDSGYQAQLRKVLAEKKRRDRNEAANASATTAKNGEESQAGKKTTPLAMVSSNRYKNLPRDLSLIRTMEGLPSHKSVFAVCTRRTPLAFYSKRTMQLIKTVSEADLGGTRPSLITYLPAIDVFLAYSFDDRCVRGWRNMLSHVTNTVPLTPVRVEGTVLCMHTRPDSFSTSVFVGSTCGSVFEIRAPESTRAGIQLQIVNTFAELHSHDEGGVVDIAMSTTHLYSLGFDGNIVCTAVATGNRSLLGTSLDPVSRIVYCDAFHLVVGVTLGKVVLYWDGRSQLSTPGSVMSYGGHVSHHSRIVDVVMPPDLPQVITVDLSGEVRVWDMRLLECTQSVRADGVIDDVLDPVFIYGENRSSQETTSVSASAGSGGTFSAPRPKKNGDIGAVISLAYFAGTHEIVTCIADTIRCLQYNARGDPHLCDVDVVHKALYNVRAKAFVLQGPTRLSTWDGQHGFRRRVVDRCLDPMIPPERREICAFCLDDLGGRYFIALMDGTVEVHTTAVGEDEVLGEWSVEEGFVSDMFYCSDHRLLAGISSTGQLLLICEEDAGPYSVCMSVATSALCNLTIGVELGLVGFCDEENNCMLFHDIKQLSSPPHRVRLDRPTLAMMFLGSAPAVATTHDDGLLVLWSCPPAIESYTPLVTFDVWANTPSMIRLKYENTGGLTGAAVARRKSHFRAAGEIPVAGQRNGSRSRSALFATTSPRCSAAWMDAVISARMSVAGDAPPKCLALRILKLLEEGTDASAASRAQTGTPNTPRHNHGPGRFSTMARLQGRRKMTTTSLAAERDAVALAFDNASHRLFLGDSTGEVRVYSLCSVLQAFALEKCAFEARRVFHLRKPSWKEMKRGAAVPTLLRTTRVHKEHRGILFMQWSASANVLISSGEDRTVVLLNAEGEILNWLSMSRLPPPCSTTGDTDDRLGHQRPSDDELLSFVLPPPSVVMESRPAYAQQGLHSEDSLSDRLYCQHMSSLFNNPATSRPASPLDTSSHVVSFYTGKGKRGSNGWQGNNNKDAKRAASKFSARCDTPLGTTNGGANDELGRTRRGVSWMNDNKDMLTDSTSSGGDGDSKRSPSNSGFLGSLQREPSAPFTSDCDYVDSKRAIYVGPPDGVAHKSASCSTTSSNNTTKLGSFLPNNEAERKESYSSARGKDGINVFIDKPKGSSTTSEDLSGSTEGHAVGSDSPSPSYNVGPAGARSGAGIVKPYYIEMLAQRRQQQLLTVPTFNPNEDEQDSGMLGAVNGDVGSGDRQTDIIRGAERHELTMSELLPSTSLVSPRSKLTRKGTMTCIQEATGSARHGEAPSWIFTALNPFHSKPKPATVVATLQKTDSQETTITSESVPMPSIVDGGITRPAAQTTTAEKSISSAGIFLSPPGETEDGEEGMQSTRNSSSCDDGGGGGNVKNEYEGRDASIGHAFAGADAAPDLSSATMHVMLSLPTLTGSAQGHTSVTGLLPSDLQGEDNCKLATASATVTTRRLPDLPLTTTASTTARAAPIAMDEKPMLQAPLRPCKRAKPKPIIPPAPAALAYTGKLVVEELHQENLPLAVITRSVEKPPSHGKKEYSLPVVSSRAPPPVAPSTARVAPRRTGAAPCAATSRAFTMNRASSKKESLATVGGGAAAAGTAVLPSVRTRRESYLSLVVREYREELQRCLVGVGASERRRQLTQGRTRQDDAVSKELEKAAAFR